VNTVNNKRPRSKSPTLEEHSGKITIASLKQKCLSLKITIGSNPTKAKLLQKLATASISSPITPTSRTEYQASYYAKKRKIQPSIDNLTIDNFNSQVPRHLIFDESNKKSLYLKEFDSNKNNHIHEQDWYAAEIGMFNTNINKLNPYFCNKCHELWPNESKICETCKRSKNKYCQFNSMNPNIDQLPDNIKKHIEQITMIEEMLISPILGVMSICRLPGGQLISKGYVANFSQDITPLCTQLPRLTKSLPILIVKKADQENNNKEFKVNRNRVTELLRFFCKNNPDFIKHGNNKI